jgi:TonB family protein
MSRPVLSILLCLAIGIFAFNIPSVSSAQEKADSLQTSSNPSSGHSTSVVCEGLPGVKAAREEEIDWNGERGVSKSCGQRIFKPVPPYPAEAKKADIEGTVVAWISVDNAGIVRTANADNGPDSLLVDAALRAACQARFRPNAAHGEGEYTIGKVTYHFNLQDRPW